MEPISKGWKILIGCHTDDLSNCQTARQLNMLALSFGGLVYVLSPDLGGCISLSLINIVKAPYLDFTKLNTIEDWPRRKNASDLWAELAG